MPKILSLSIALLFALSACERDEDQLEIAASLSDMVEALSNANWKALWDTSHPEAQDQILDLHRTLSESLRAVEDLYPIEEQPIARAALGRDLVSEIKVGDADAGPRLLSRLFASGAIRLDEKTRDGLSASSAAIDGDRAVVNTAAGEIFTFGRADGRWKSRLLTDMLNESRAVRTLKESALAVAAAQEAKDVAWKTSSNPKEAQGAYNLIRSAIERTPVDAPVVYALLDSGSKASLVEALKLARLAQARLQKRSKKSKRDATYERHNLTLFVKAGSDRELYEAWSKTKTFKAPLKDVSPPLSLETGQDADHVTLTTESKEKVNFVRESDGIWRISDSADTIAKEFITPLQALLTKLGIEN